MFRNFIITTTALLLLITDVNAKPAIDPIQAALNAHYNTYKPMEYFSGIAVSVYKPGQAITSYYAGNVSHDANAAPVNANTLFQIGSITKSYVTAILLQLQKEKKLKLSDTMQQWLPEYKNWLPRDITSLLNMTSGLPNYTDSPLINAGMYHQPSLVYSAQDLIAFVYPKNHLTPPMRHGYNYTNTGYIIAGMIIEKVTHDTLQHQLQTRLLTPLKLQNTYYPLPDFPAAANASLAHGYSYNPYANPELLGKDVSQTSPSWAAAAGAMVSNGPDVINWVKALFVDNTILDKAQQKELMQSVSTATGLPIAKATRNDPRGFGLGVGVGYQDDVGQFWYYEGETEGFRAAYMYVPKTGIIVVAIMNSAVNGENDHAGELVNVIYQLVKNKK